MPAFYMNGDHLAGPRRRRGAPPAGERLTREDLLRHATEAIARTGPAGFTVRGLAQTLGVAPSALYNHAPDRSALLTAVAERFLASITLPAGGQPWAAWLRACAASLRDQLRQNPGLTELVLTRGGATAAGPQLLSRFLDHSAAAGIHRATAHVAWHALLTVVVGSLDQDRATFEAVLDMTIAGVLEAAREDPSQRALDLLRSHRLDRPEAG